MTEAALVITPSTTRLDRTRRRLVLAAVVGTAGAAGACTGFTPTRDVLGDRGVVVRSVTIAEDEPWRHDAHAAVAEANAE